MSPIPAQTEPIFSALFALANKANVAPTPFVSMSRRFRHWSQVSVDHMPSFYQFQVPQSVRQNVQGATRQDLRAWWFVYLRPSSDLNDVVSTTMNKYRDALINTLYPVFPGGTQIMPGAKNTLGGLVNNCYVDGEVLMDEGLLEPPSLIRIPITINLGM